MADLLSKLPLPYELKRENRFILRFPASMGINEWFVENAMLFFMVSENKNTSCGTHAMLFRTF